MGKVLEFKKRVKGDSVDDVLRLKAILNNRSQLVKLVRIRFNVLPTGKTEYYLVINDIGRSILRAVHHG